MNDKIENVWERCKKAIVKEINLKSGQWGQILPMRAWDKEVNMVVLSPGGT